MVSTLTLLTPQQRWWARLNLFGSLPGWSSGSKRLFQVSISCRWLPFPGWAWIQSAATSLLIKLDQFHKEGTVLYRCLLPFWQGPLGKVSMKWKMSFWHIWKGNLPQLSSMALCLPLSFENYAGHYSQADKRWSHNFRCAHPKVWPILLGKQTQNTTMPSVLAPKMSFFQ